MAWLSLGNLSTDFAGAVTKLSESVKSIERNFDTALGLEGSSTDPKPGGEAEVRIPPDSDSAVEARHQEEESARPEQPHDWEDSKQADQTSTAEPVVVEDAHTEAAVDAHAEDAVDANGDGDDTFVQVEQHETAAPETESVVSEESRSTIAEVDDVDKMKLELKNMEKALQAAAKQSQFKAEEISRLLQENDHLKCALDEAKKKASEVELDALREEYQHRLGAAERKVYALTKERDMLRREQNRKSDSSALLKEKDEIIKQVMAEGEELSKKQAAQEATIKKLRAQVRELEEEKQRLNSKLQVEEAKIESLRKDKAATEKVLQETVEKGHADLAAQREFYSKMVNEAREAEARAEARANTQAKADLDQRLHEAAEREAALVQAVEELRQSLSRAEQQAAYREDLLRKDIESLEKRCQDAETRYDDLVARVPESTRPLLRQIEAMQESSAMRTEAWTGVERALNSRLQEAEAKAAAAQERERAMNERLSQTLSRIAVMEAQVSCVKAELSQVTRSLEKERQRASENRQEYLAALETAATHEGQAKQLEQELKELKEKQIPVLADERSRRVALEQELEKERATRLDLEQRLQTEARVFTDVSGHSTAENSSNRNIRRLPSIASVNSMEEGQILQASLGSSSPIHERYKFMEPISPRLVKGMVPATTLEQFEAVMRQKEGELTSYASRLAELESTRDSLAEELVRTTTQCEKLRSEASALRGVRAEMESLRRRHVSALELMGERDEQVEELRADLQDVKQMYREQIDMLVNQIERLSRSNS